jgi:hypothetical protein
MPAAMIMDETLSAAASQDEAQSRGAAEPEDEWRQHPGEGGYEAKDAGPPDAEEDPTSASGGWSDLGSGDGLHGDGVVVDGVVETSPAATRDREQTFAAVVAERDALRACPPAVAADRDRIRAHVASDVVVASSPALAARARRAVDVMRTVDLLRRYGAFTRAQDLRLRLGAFDETDWLVAGLAAERDWDAPARYRGTIFGGSEEHAVAALAADDASELTADDDDALTVRDDWPDDVTGAAALVLLAAVLAGVAITRR